MKRKQNTQEVEMNGFFNVEKAKIMCEFSAHVAFNKATDAPADIKQDKNETLSSMSLLKVELRSCIPREDRRVWKICT